MRKIVIPTNRLGEVDASKLDKMVDWSQPHEVERVIFSVGEPDHERLISEVLEQPSLARINWAGGHTLLHVAATNRQFELVKILLQCGAKADCFDGFSHPIHEAAEGCVSSSGIVELLLEYGANINATDRKSRTPLHLAVRSNNMPVIHLLLANGASTSIRDSSGDTPGDIARRFLRRDIVELIARHEGSSKGQG